MSRPAQNTKGRRWRGARSLLSAFLAASVAAALLYNTGSALSTEESVQEARSAAGKRTGPSGGTAASAGSGEGGSSSHGAGSGVPPPKPRFTNAEISRRCAGTRGSWCRAFFSQQPIPSAAPPRGEMACLWDSLCNFVGVCNHASGWCRCPAGWTGDDCSIRMKRPCSQWPRKSGFVPNKVPGNISDPGTLLPGIPKEARMLMSRCPQLCDEDIGACFCNSTWAHGRQPAPADKPPGTPPVRLGRPLHHQCYPNRDDAGNSAPDYGPVDPESLYGPAGWCQANRPQTKCPCVQDGFAGEFCDQAREPFCVNQCSGHGECMSGFCRCHPGWWGQDCAYRNASTRWSPGLEQKERPWLRGHVHTPASEDPTPGSTRLRPLIYVYEVPAMYNQVMLQYRWNHTYCVHRLFNGTNSTQWVDEWLYGIETGLHEMLLQSEHRTLDPQEADFFYLPVYTSCYIHPMHGWGDAPFFHSFHNIHRVHGAVNMLLEALQWARTRHPWWRRNGGRDHIVLAPWDEGSCWVPAALRPAIVLTHWGRTDFPHTANTWYRPDNYSQEARHEVYMPEGAQSKLGSFPCFDPEKDLVIPPLASPAKFSGSPMLGAPARDRFILAFFKGQIMHKWPAYSRGIRQKLQILCREQDWWGKHLIHVGEGLPLGVESYSQALASSLFCFVLPGSGWSSRLEDAVLHGCLPVIIQDQVQSSFETILDISKFSLRIPEQDIERVPELLEAVEPERVEEMQRALARVWRRFAYTSLRSFGAAATRILEHNTAEQQQQGQADSGSETDAWAHQSLPHPLRSFDPSEGDALETIMAWLYSRIPHTHPGREPRWGPVPVQQDEVEHHAGQLQDKRQHEEVQQPQQRHKHQRHKQQRAGRPQQKQGP